MSNPFTTKDPLFDIINQVMLGEKKLTDAELKKREEIVLAIKRENPDMEKSKAYAIATARAQEVAEEVELDEAMKPFTDADHATADKHGTKIEKNLENIKKVPTKHLQYLHHHNMGYASSGGYLHHALPHIETELKKRGKKPLSDEDGEKVFNESFKQIDESVFDSKDAAQSVVNKLKTKHDDGNYHVKADNGKHRVTHAYYPNSTVKKQIARLDGEVEELEEGPFKGVGKFLMKRKLKSGAVKSAKDADSSLEKAFDHKFNDPKRFSHEDDFMAKSKDASRKMKAHARLNREEVELDEVAMPQNQADWQALITHQIKTAGHPVATDAQFRAPHGKDTSKIASQEPPEDKMNYAAAQGGTVKQ